MQFSTDERHAATLAFLAEVADYIASWPSHAMNRDMIRRIEAHLAEPTNKLACDAARRRSGFTVSREGERVVMVSLVGDTATVTVPPEGACAPDDVVLSYLRAGERVVLHPGRP